MSDIIPPPASARQITLQVGEKRFVTTHSTLTDESGFFSSLLSGRWNNVQEDGSWFIDADPVLFEHILRYLRRGVFPVFYDKSKGHDHALYLALLEEARYFQIDRLQGWLESKKYFEAVTIRCRASEVEEMESLDKTTSANLEVEFHPSWLTRTVYVCPRKIASHRGNPDACGRRCRSAQEDDDDEYVEERILSTVVIYKETILNQNICTAGQAL
jgi:hypothetical protein